MGWFREGKKPTGKLARSSPKARKCYKIVEEVMKLPLQQAIEKAQKEVEKLNGKKNQNRKKEVKKR